MNYQRTVFSRLLPFAAYIVLLALDGTLVSLLELVQINPKFSYVIRISAVIALLAYFWRDYIELNTKPVVSDFLYAAVAGGIVFMIWIFPYPEWLGGGDTLGFNPYGGESQLAGLWWASVRLMGAAMVVPLMEELFWRSYVMRWFDKSDFLLVSPERVSGYAYLGSACLFALEHHLWLAGLIAGLVYGELYKTYRNLWVPIAAHAVTNAMLGLYVLGTNHWSYW
ncbi:MAG: CAAX prenyl protease-related protein [Methylophilaceae bacterium 17-44-8]|jgi:hypothetical protein|nr:MAG: CAAX prenyl protease-related protein [Methylophilales bacterium 28-44-11]OZA06695.1 MAG: CAAX prenyl protease-related protein [Methylophilaceae bacterium 17-44-8]